MARNTNLEELIRNLITSPASRIQTPEFDLEKTRNGKVGGFIISPTFAGMPQIERQNMLWDYLDAHLDRDQLLHVVSLVTVTPDEARAL